MEDLGSFMMNKKGKMYGIWLGLEWVVTLYNTKNLIKVDFNSKYLKQSIFEKFVAHFWL